MERQSIQLLGRRITMASMRRVFTICVLILLSAALAQLQLTTAYDCTFTDISPSIAAILCAVEQGRWHVPRNSSAVRQAGCLLGGRNRCSTRRATPTQAEVPVSPAPPSAKNKQYQVRPCVISPPHDDPSFLHTTTPLANNAHRPWPSKPRRSCPRPGGGTASAAICSC